VAFDIREGILTMEDDDGQRIGIGVNTPAMRFDVGEAGASCAGMGVGIGSRTPSCRFEVRSDGAVGVKAVGMC
jgi:hypothetical protein